MLSTFEFDIFSLEEMAEKRRFLMYISYIGTGFCGSQYQVCKSTGTVYPTVQNSLETALKHVFLFEGERPIIVHFCSRTDSGVHALKAAVHVDLPKLRNRFLSPCSIKQKLNTHFKNLCSIRILDVINVPDSFNVHRACLSKTYLYRVGILKKEFQENNYIKKDDIPITEVQRTYFIINKDFDLKRAEEATSLFVGEKDFAAIGRKPNKNIRPTVCNILSFTIENASPQMAVDQENEKYDYYHFICKGTRFLFHMVRSMVGVVLSVGMGRTSLGEVKMLFEKPEPSSWLSKYVVVPSHGLYLIDTTLDRQSLIVEEKEENEMNLDLQSTTNNAKSSGAAAA